MKSSQTNRLFTHTISLAAMFVISMIMNNCASTAAVQNAPLHAGVGRTFNASFDRTLKAAREAVTEAGLQIESASQMDENTWMILGKKSMSAWSYGELVRVLVSRKGAQRTEVRVFTKKRVSINLTAKGDYSNAILSNVELKLTT
ncbi:MAG: hypothetical protein ACE5I1_01805 [bacterium]